MANEESLKFAIRELFAKYNALLNKNTESEKRAEEFIRTLFEAMGWEWLSREVPQKQVRSGVKTTRVDYSFRRSIDARPSFYIEVKKFSDPLQDSEHINQALEYGKNGGIRWVVLTNFTKWRVFNSDFFNEPEHAEIFEFDLAGCMENVEYMQWLMLFSRERAGAELDEYAKMHKKWKESADIEDLLAEHLIDIRLKISRALYDQNPNIDFESEGSDEEKSLDACVQHILNRVIFCRMLEDNSVDSEFRLKNIIEKWETKDKRVQFYKEYLIDFWRAMKKRYDSTIFDEHRIDGCSLKNEDLIPILKSFYINEDTGLKYRFEAIGTDILGHAYENYLSYKVKQTEKRTGVDRGEFTRKQGGIYYTPEFLVDYLISSTLGEKLKKCRSPEEALKIRVIDPACGSGTFLVRAFDEFKAWFSEQKRMKNQLSQTKPNFESESGITGFLNEVIEKCLYGIDIDQRAVELAKLNLFLRAIDTPDKLPTPNIIRRNSLSTDKELREIFRQHREFILQKDFPLIYENGGFDVVLGNPPWDKWKPDSQEFFEKYYPGFKSLPTQEAKKRIEELLKRKTVKTAWQHRNEEFDMFSDHFHESFSFQAGESDGRQVSGDLDLYKLFTEKAYMLLKDGGSAGLVLPSGIYTDLGAKGLRAMLFDRCQLKALYSFENRGHVIFPDVHASYKPILLVFQKGGKTLKFPCAFFLHSAEDLIKAEKFPTVMEIDFVRSSSPTSWSVLEIKNPKDLEIVNKLLKHPPLGKEIPGTWNIELQSGFHMTNDSHLFKQGLIGVPMLEGKNIEQFTHKWKEHPIPIHKILERDIEANLKPEKIYHNGYWLGWRDVSSSTNHRTLICTVIPPGYVCGNTINFVRLPNLKELCFLCGIANSFVVDFYIRQKVSAHVNHFSFREIPIPRLSSGKEFEAIVRKVAQLVCTTGEFAELKNLVGVEPVTSESDRALARAQLDVMVAKLYGVTKEEMAHILEQFPNVEQGQKDLVLREY